MSFRGLRDFFAHFAILLESRRTRRTPHAHRLGKSSAPYTGKDFAPRHFHTSTAELKKIELNPTVDSKIFAKPAEETKSSQ